MPNWSVIFAWIIMVFIFVVVIVVFTGIGYAIGLGANYLFVGIDNAHWWCAFVCNVVAGIALYVFGYFVKKRALDRS